MGAIRHPDEIVTTHGYAMLLGKVHDVITSRVVEVRVALRDRVHLAAVLRSDQSELIRDLVLVGLVILEAPVVDGGTDVNTGSFGGFFEGLGLHGATQLQVEIAG